MCVTQTKNKCLQTLSYQGEDVGTRHTKRPDRDVTQGGEKTKTQKEQVQATFCLFASQKHPGYL